MGFSSLDDLISEITGGKYLRREIAKTTTPAHTAGGWNCLAGANGYPVQTTWPGSDLIYQNCTDLYGDGTNIFGIQHGGDVAPDTKHIVNLGAMMVAAAGAPWQLKLVDLQGYYNISGANVTGTSARTCVNSQTFTASSSTGLLLTYTNDHGYLVKVRFTNSGGVLPTGLSIDTDYWLIRQGATTSKVATSYANAVAGTYIAWTDNGTGTHTMRIQMPRYANGVGCQAFFVVKTAPLTGGPNMTASAYDNTTEYAGIGTNAFPGTPSFGAAADAYAMRIPHSGAAASGRYGPFLPLAAGTLGVARINSFTLSGGTAYTGSGVMSVCIGRPLLDLALPVTGMWSERDLVNQLCSLPKVEDGACLVWLIFATGATTNNSPLTAAIDFAWG